MKKKLPPLTPEHEAFDKQTAQAEDETTKYFIPVYAIDENKQRYALGSAVLLKITKRRFCLLIDGEHVWNNHEGDQPLLFIDAKSETIDSAT